MRPWASGGAMYALSNLATVCWWCHRLIHCELDAIGAAGKARDDSCKAALVHVRDYRRAQQAISTRTVDVVTIVDALPPVPASPTTTSNGVAWSEVLDRIRGEDRRQRTRERFRQRVRGGVVAAALIAFVTIGWAVVIGLIYVVLNTLG